jgi:integrase
MADSTPKPSKNVSSDRSGAETKSLAGLAEASELPELVGADGFENDFPSLIGLISTAKTYADARSSANTTRAYLSDWKQFERWCRRLGIDQREPNPQVVGLFLTASAAGKDIPQAAVSTIERRLAAITTMYRSAGTPLPRQDRHIIDVLAGIRRTHGRQPKRKEAVLAEDVLNMVAALPQNLRGFRDKAVLLLGFAGGLRRSEIVGLDCGPDQTEDGTGWIDGREEGLVLTLRGKTGWRTVEVGRGSSDRSCPVQALETWLQLAKISKGPVFRRVRKQNTGVGVRRLADVHVARLVKKTALAAGVLGDLPEGDRLDLFSGHSLRAGLPSSQGLKEADVQRQLGHTSVQTTRGYQRRRERFRVNLTKAAGL